MKKKNYFPMQPQECADKCTKLTNPTCKAFALDSLNSCYTQSGTTSDTKTVTISDNNPFYCFTKVNK